MFDQLESALTECQVSDIHRFRRRLDQARKTSSSESQQSKLKSLKQDIERSRAFCEVRENAIPRNIQYPENLPFSAKAEEIVEQLKKHQVLVVAGDTGSGKTTQLPKICLQAGFGRRGLIGHTQPRRLAASSVANRVAEELGVKLGEGVGYQVRFTEKLSKASFLKIMTDGILLAEIQQDRFLNKYEVLIIDEAHERSLNIDFLLGFLKQLLSKRPELKLVITSATIDLEKFSAHFDDAPIVSVSGRTFPVEVRYAPLIKQSESGASADPYSDGILEAVKTIQAEDRDRGGISGDILVFLATERDIRETAQLLRKQRFRDTEILPLYARLRHSEQVKIFQQHRGRRIVLTTNVAETSITVPGINYVIDTGLARISRYSLQNKVQRLPIESVSQASANQRKGRCGRLADGICIRLYSEQDFESRPVFTDPEILRTNLASVILRMRHLKLGDVEGFPFLETPERRAVNEGFKLLIELNALNSKRELTRAGRQMAMLPVDPRYARMLITAHTERCLNEMLIIVSAMSIQDPRESGTENRQQALQKQTDFQHPDSDFLVLVNLWHEFESRRQELSQSQLRKYCKQHHLSYIRMREWREVHRQLLLSSQQLGLKLNKDKAEYAAIHKAIISGSLNQVAVRYEGKQFQGNRNKRFNLFPNSTLSGKSAKWIVTGDLIETSQTFAAMAAKIQPEWIEEKALHLVKREHFNPHWSKKRQQVMVNEKVILYGLVIIESKAVGLSTIDAKSAREIFIRDALIPEELNFDPPFMKHNRHLLEELERQEEKIRRPDYFVSERDLVRFYEERIPDHVCSTVSLKKWLQKQSKQQLQQLCMSMESLLDKKGVTDEELNFPDHAPLRHNRLEIEYKFEPGNSRDGATLQVPLAILTQLNQADIDWAVPGIVKDKCIALIKGLPKSLRKNFIPVNGFVEQIMPQMIPGEGDLLSTLLTQIKLQRKIAVERKMFANIELPEHLKIKLSVLDEAGCEIALDDDIESLKKKLISDRPAREENSAPRESIHPIEQSGLVDWSIDALPEEIEVGESLILIRYPALIDSNESVGVKLFADPDDAIRNYEKGLARLFMLRTSQQRRMLQKQFNQFEKRHALILPSTLKNFCDEAIYSTYRGAFNIEEELARNKEAFDRQLDTGKQALFVEAGKIENLLATVLQDRFEVTRSISKLDQTGLKYVRQDIERQLNELFGETFLVSTPRTWLNQYPRYLQAIRKRLERAPHLGPRDREHTEEIQLFWQRYRDLCDSGHTQSGREIDLLRWMIEEYRVSLFAQSLGTHLPVSAKRINKHWEQIRN